MNGLGSINSNGCSTVICILWVWLEANFLLKLMQMASSLPFFRYPRIQIHSSCFLQRFFFFFFFYGPVVNQCSDDTQRHQREFLQCVESNVGQRLVGVGGCLQNTHNIKDDVYSKKKGKTWSSVLFIPIAAIVSNGFHNLKAAWINQTRKTDRTRRTGQWIGVLTSRKCTADKQRNI